MLAGAAAGALAATVWALQEPLDMKLFGVDYSDPVLLAKPVGGSRGAGLAIHCANGAIFGATYSVVAPRVPGPGFAKGVAAALAEHVATWPLTRLLPGVHLWGNHRAFAQGVWRHTLFGAILGTLLERLSPGYAERAPA